MLLIFLLSFFALTSAAVDQLGVDQCNCRLKATQKIVGGQISQANGYPWQVSLNDEYGLHICSGIILNSQWVLTSYKCILKKNPSYLYVRPGVDKLSDLDREELMFEVEDIKGREVFALALLKLKDPIFFTKGLIEPACLNSKENKVYTDGLVATGWGATEKTIENEFLGSFSDLLKEAVFKEDKKANCISSLLCVKGVKKGDSVCHGDEGGPIHYTENGITTVEGLLEFIEGQKTIFTKEISFCFGEAGFGRIAGNQLKWIETIMGKDHC